MPPLQRSTIVEIFGALKTGGECGDTIISTIVEIFGALKTVLELKSPHFWEILVLLQLFPFSFWTKSPYLSL